MHMNKLSLVIALAITASCKDELGPFVCNGGPVTVIEIVELRNRSAVIKLSSGELVVINQAECKVGDKIIVRSKYYACGLSEPPNINYIKHDTSKAGEQGYVDMRGAEK